MRIAVLLACLPLLAGCNAVADIAALGVGGAAGAATGSPAVGFAVGVGVQAGVREIKQYIVRRRWQGEQDAIAEVAGAAPVGEARAWEIRHTIPIGNERGELAVLREFTTPLATCREIAFSVVDDGQREVFTTMLCRGAGGWRWAAAEPAVDRWGFLQ